MAADEEDRDAIEEAVHCGFRGEHLGHHYFTDIGTEEWCNGFEPRFRSRPENDEAFDWDDYDEPDLDTY